MRLEHVDPLSAARIMGLVNFLGGTIGGAGMMGLSIMSDTRFDLDALVVIPLMYGALGFFGGLLGSLFFNWAARLFGGIAVTLSTTPD